MQDRHHISGIREPLPQGETLLWEGRPDPRALAVRVFHIRWVAAYFAGLLIWALATAAPEASLLAVGAWIALQAAVVLGLVWGYAVWTARTTLYSLTGRRVVIVKGAVLPSVVNIPFRRIRNIAFHRGADGGGGIALELVPGGRVGYTFLWPHARPWKLSRPEPMLRCLPDVDAAAEPLREAYSAFLEEDSPAPQESRTVYRLLDDDDTPVLFNTPTPAGAGGASEAAR